MSKNEHWADPYRDAPSNTLEGKIWLTACYTQHATEEEVRAIAQIAHDQNTNIWHATWLFRGATGHCGCACCERAQRAV
jgi:hypothetical protein